MNTERDDGCSVIRVPNHRPLTGASVKAQREPPAPAAMDQCGWSVGLVLCRCKETRIANIIMFAEVAVMLCGFMLFISADVIDVVGAQEACELVYYLERSPAPAEVSLCSLSAVQTVIGIFAFLRFIRAGFFALMVIWRAAAWCGEHTHVAHMLRLSRRLSEPHLELFEGVFYLMFAFLAKHFKVLESSMLCLGLGLSIAFFWKLFRVTGVKSARIRGLWAMNTISRRLVRPGEIGCLRVAATNFMNLVSPSIADLDIKAAMIAQELREQVMAECDDIRELLLEVEALGLETHDETAFVRLPLMRNDSGEHAVFGGSRPDSDQRISVSSMSEGPSSKRA